MQSGTAAVTHPGTAAATATAPVATNGAVATPMKFSTNFSRIPVQRHDGTAAARRTIVSRVSYAKHELREYIGWPRCCAARSASERLRAKDSAILLPHSRRSWRSQDSASLSVLSFFCAASINRKTESCPCAACDAMLRADYECFLSRNLSRRKYNSDITQKSRVSKVKTKSKRSFLNLVA